MKTCPRCGNKVGLAEPCNQCSGLNKTGGVQKGGQVESRSPLAPLTGVDYAELPDVLTGRGTAFDGNLLPSAARVG